MTAPGPQITAVALSHSPQMAQDTDHLQGGRFRAGFAQLAKAVATYDPTLVLYFGPDHMRALAGIAPCFTVVESATGYGDWGTPAEQYRVPKDLAVALGEHLAASGIDIAMAPELRLDHGFGQSTHDLFGSLSAVPLIPIVINCVDRPIPTAARTAALGAAAGAFLRTHLSPDERVLVIGSGGISHAPPSLIPGARDLTEADRQKLITDNIARAAEAINPEWDQRFLARLGSDGLARTRRPHRRGSRPCRHRRRRGAHLDRRRLRRRRPAADRRLRARHRMDHRHGHRRRPHPHRNVTASHG